jgi:hypothetical protein
MEMQEVNEVGEVNEAQEGRQIGSEGEFRVDEAPISRVFAYEWQGKDLRDRECVRVAGKGLTGGHFCALAQEARLARFVRDNTRNDTIDRDVCQ